MSDGPWTEPARWDAARKCWRVDVDAAVPGMEPTGFVCWGRGTLGCGATEAEARASWCESMRLGDLAGMPTR